MIDAYDRAQAVRQKIKNFGLDEGDQEEVRQLMAQLMILAEVFSLHDSISFEMTSRGWEFWEFNMVSRVSSETKAELHAILSEV